MLNQRKEKCGTCLNVKLRKKIIFYDSKDLSLRKLEQKYLESFKIYCSRRMEKIKWSDKMTNEEVLEHIGEKRMLINSNLHRKPIRLEYPKEKLPTS